MQYLKATEFVVVDPATREETLGRQDLISTGFDPDRCEITVSDNGILNLEQGGHKVSLSVGPQFWHRISLH